jgi:outer membrane protein assembly factor BamB
VAQASSLYVARYSRGGTLQWEAEEAGGTFQQPAGAAAAATDRKGEVFVTGATGGRFVVARYAGSDGERAWLTSVGDGTGSGEALAVSADGAVAAAGFVERPGVESLVTLLDPGTGTPRWTWRTSDPVRALAFDSAGNVLATGGFLAVKLAASDGAVLWQTRTAGPEADAVGFPVMRSLVVDPKGDVLVGGSLRNTLDDYRAFHVARVDGETGAVEWQHTGTGIYSMEAATGLHLSGRNLYAGGRRDRLPAALRLDPRTGSVGWSRQPFAQDDRPDQAFGVTHTATDGRYFLTGGSDGLRRVVLAAFSAAGKARWQKDYGPGELLALTARAQGKVFFAAVLPSSTGAPQSVLVGLNGASGAELPADKRKMRR